MEWLLNIRDQSANRLLFLASAIKGCQVAVMKKGWSHVLESKTIGIPDYISLSAVLVVSPNHQLTKMCLSGWGRCCWNEHSARSGGGKACWDKSFRHLFNNKCCCHGLWWQCQCCQPSRSAGNWKEKIC